MADRPVETDGMVAGDMRVGFLGRVRRRPADGPVRVVQVLHRLSVDGGIPVAVRSVASSVDPTTVDLHIVTARPLVPVDRLDEVPAAIHSLGYKGDRHGLWSRMRLVVNVALVVRRLRPQVMQVHSGTSWMGLLAAVMRPSMPIVLEVHDAPGSGRHGDLTELVERWWFRRRLTLALCHSRSVAESLPKGGVIDRSRTVVVPLAVDATRFRPARPGSRAAWRARHGVADDAVVVVTAGRLVRSKRVGAVIEAIADARTPRDLVLAVIGGGPMLGELRSLARRLGCEDRVVFTGRVDQPGLIDALASADLACSASEYEGFGLVSAEAMACGIPVVSTAVGGAGEVVRDGETGCLVTAGDHDALVHAMRALATDSGKRARMGRAGRDRVVREYHPVVVGRIMSDLYRAVAGREAPVRGACGVSGGAGR